MAEGLRTEVHGNVGVVIMDRPPHNFLNFRQIHDIADALEEMQNDMSIRCAVLAADGRSFCAGADFAGDGVGGGDDEVVGGDATLALYQGSGRLFDVTLYCWRHTGARRRWRPRAGNGPRYTYPRAQTPDFQPTLHHWEFIKASDERYPPAIVGPVSRRQVLYSAKRYKGEEAVAIGLADECIPNEQVRERALEVATEIAANAPLVQSSQLYDSVLAIQGAETTTGSPTQAQLSASDDAKEGIAAVGERRAGNFKGK